MLSLEGQGVALASLARRLPRSVLGPNQTWTGLLRIPYVTSSPLKPSELGRKTGRASCTCKIYRKFRPLSRRISDAT